MMKIQSREKLLPVFVDLHDRYLHHVPNQCPQPLQYQKKVWYLSHSIKTTEGLDYYEVL